ncbi:MAG: 4-alpha-glucanotransferase [Microthrixaceae bacterium]
MTTDAWGIDDGWAATDGQWRPAPPATLEAIGEAMGRDERPEPPGRPVWIVRPGAHDALLGRCAVVLEDGSDLGEIDALPPDLPLGLHRLRPLDGGLETTLVVSPGRCHVPDALRTWGVAMQIPTTRSRAGWGVGDLADVRAIATWIGRLGAGALALSPLHAPAPTIPIQTSPYYPSSRRWRSPLLLRVDDVPGAAGVPELAELAAKARNASERAGPTIDRDAVWRCQQAALERLWTARSDTSRSALDRWRAEHGPTLEGWARYCALAERHGHEWQRWPAPLRHPDEPAVAHAAAELADRVAFHSWLQLLVDDQLRSARVDSVRLIQDLAVGVDPSGADAWLDQDLLALEVSVGAPPDDFAPDGQRWGLPPFVPWRLRDAGYRPLAELLRASMSPDGGLRVDHVMGLSRLFWIPGGASPAEGTYVRHRGRELLEILALESSRARALVIGEDLGTVEEELRHDLRATGVFSTRLVWFEDDPPERYPSEALAMVTTHDLPTIAGVWTGDDEAELAALGRSTPADERSTLRRRLDALVDLPADRPVEEVIDVAHHRLGQAAAQLVVATLEDACGVSVRPNVPGTTDERPNWSRALPLAVEDLIEDASANRHLARLAAGRGA